MELKQAIGARRSVRAFLADPVDPVFIGDLLAQAARSPSGGNLQPWHVTTVSGERLKLLKVEAAAAKMGEQELEYPIYPANLTDPYRARRFANGEDLYASLGIPREDKAQRASWFARNFEFFGAPLGVFIHTPRYMGPPQWSDLGMFLQTFMLLLVDAGLDSCPQEAWAIFPDSVRRHVPIAADMMLFCGVAVGRADPEHRVNSLRTDRAPTAEWLSHVE